MKRIDGYLCIDDYFRKLVDREKGQYWVYIDGVEYYFKPSCISGLLYSELIAYYMALELGVEVCFCDLAELNGERGYISKSLRSDNIELVPGEVILGDYLVNSLKVIADMGLCDDGVKMLKEDLMDDVSGCFCSDYVNTLEIIWQALEYRYGGKINIESVMNQFVLMYMYTIICGDADKHPGNWLVIESKENIRLAPLFDNELILNDYFSDVNLSVNFSDFNCSIFASLREFFKVSASEYFDLFIEKFEKIVDSFELILFKVESQIGMEIPFDDKQYIIDSFNKNIDGIRRVIRDNIEVRGYKKKSRIYTKD